MGNRFKQNIKNSFLKVKDDITLIKHEIRLQKEVLIKQSEVINKLKLDINEILLKINLIEKHFFYKKSSKNRPSERASTERALSEHMSTKVKMPFKGVSIGNNGVEHMSTHRAHTEHTPSTHRALKIFSEDQALKTIENYINSTFKMLSKQELKTFLTIYKLEDDSIIADYSSIAIDMSISENRSRAYVSNLIKKGAPIIKNKVNNKISLFSIKKDFKALNLKNKLIDMYYEKDSHQTTLFDIT